jgi:multiple antibiotic resistance protein
MKILHDFLLIFLPLFVVVDPAGTIPVYLALTSHHSLEQRRRIAAHASSVAAVTGVLFVILGQGILSFLGLRFEDFQIAGGILLAVLAIIDLLIPGKPAVDEKGPPERGGGGAVGIVPLAVPLIVGPATMTTSLLLVNTYSKPYDLQFGAPLGQIMVMAMVCVALLLNLLILFGAMWYSNRLVELVGRSTLAVVNKIVMIVLAAIAVSLIRQGIVSIVLDLRR